MKVVNIKVNEITVKSLKVESRKEWKNICLEFNFRDIGKKRISKREDESKHLLTPFDVAENKFHL